MKIIMLGAGQVGASVAESLVSEDNDITIVDTDLSRLQALQDRLDLRTVQGNAALPSVLRAAGADDTDMLLAVTQSDQTNLCACRTAKTLFNIPTKVARLRSPDYTDLPELLNGDNFAVDHSICPEQIVTDYIVKLIQYPEALQVLEFAGGLVSLVAVRAVQGGALVGLPVREIRKHIPQADVRIAAIFRRDQPIIPDGDTPIEVGDEVFCLAATEEIPRVMRELRGADKPTRRIIVAGGGNIGLRLAQATESEYVVKVIERNKDRAQFLGSNLDDTLVPQGDATDETLLAGEGIASTDFFIALTNDDEDNIMASLLAKKMGARRVLALINRGVYADLVQADRIDIAISPAQISLGTLLAHVRRGDVAAVHSLRRGAAEALELIAHGDRTTSKVVGRRIDQIALPKGANIGAIVRRGRSLAVPGTEDKETEGFQVLMAHRDQIIQTDDHVIVFLANRELVPQVERLFQVVGFHFM
jgi:trk system potassium uptake protein TrkA